MEQKELSELTDQELLEEAKKMKKSSNISAFIIGFIVAIVIYSIAKNTWGLVTLIPLFLIYTMTRKSKKNEDLKKILKERDLEETKIKA